MRIAGHTRLLIPVTAYLLAIGAVMIGAPYAMRAGLSTIEQPKLLVPEYLLVKTPAASTDTFDVEVRAKPYEPRVQTKTTWRPSIVRSYVAHTAKQQSVASSKVAGKIPKNRHAQKARPNRPSKSEAMDAYASGVSWR